MRLEFCVALAPTGRNGRAATSVGALTFERHNLAIPLKPWPVVSRASSKRKLEELCVSIPS